jgi:hypothetical protein
MDDRYMLARVATAIYSSTTEDLLNLTAVRAQSLRKFRYVRSP